MPNAADLVSEIAHLMQLNEENPFKVRAFERASEVLSPLVATAEGETELKERANAGTLTDIPGIGKGIAEVLKEFLLTGDSKVRAELIAALPKGLLELTQVSGLGPKKAKVLIEELGITTLGELEYACKENRLLKLKGFGDKLQAKILEGVQFLNASRGQYRIVDAFALAEKAAAELKKLGVTYSESGALRRRLEVVSEIDFLVECPDDEAAAKKLQEKVSKVIEAPVTVAFAPRSRWGYELAHLTASKEHWEKLGAPKLPQAAAARADEAEFYRSLGLPWLPPETREGRDELELARAGELDALLPWDGVRGVFHNHTVASDGVATLEEMVREARALAYQYIGISDHSQSAFYAQGLKRDALRAQEKEVKRVQDLIPEVRIFWGVESDILADGSLDYPEEDLKRFDFVVASVHSRFGMDRTTMTERICAAIRNPYTRFLGHATGRLLLGRKPYELDMEQVIAEAADHDVAIEINANPARLDIDWRWGQELRKRKTLVSINPDAHDVEGLKDTVYGVAVARKALLPTSLVVNARSVEEVEKWLKRA